MDKRIVSFGMLLGSILGGYAPTWFGASTFSLASIFGSFIGGLAGIWLAVRFLE